MPHHRPPNLMRPNHALQFNRTQQPNRALQPNHVRLNRWPEGLTPGSPSEQIEPPIEGKACNGVEE